MQLSSGGAWVNYVASAPLPTGPFGQSVHIAAVVDRSGSQQVRFYYNGVLVGAPFPISGPMLGSLSNRSVARIGQHASGGRFFLGRIDELALYSRALTETELQSIAVAELKTGGR